MHKTQATYPHGIYTGLANNEIMFLLMSSLLWTMAVHGNVSFAYSPEVNHRAIAGVWKLRQRPLKLRYPLKEFTVYPKDKNRPKLDHSQTDEQENEILLMLKEDGSFQQYSNEEDKAPAKLKYVKADDGVLSRYFQFGRLNGKWSLVDGKLVLAAERSSDWPLSKIEDTVLEGKVVARSEDGLWDNPALCHGRNATDNVSRGDTVGSVLDTHLSVPSGQVQVGRFTYPQHHPSFFDSPMFKPVPKGNFELKQVLGTLNTQQKTEEVREKFVPALFYDKSFLLTSHPLPERKPKGNTRWSIKYNRFVGRLVMALLRFFRSEC
jgi:hypothetical protein